jgi:hypothetical protein
MSWWLEYQTCTIKSARDECGEQSGLLVNDEFVKSYTSAATSKILTYKSCLTQDRTNTFPACFLEQSIDPISLNVNADNDNELDVEDKIRRKELVEMFESKYSNSSDESNRIEASTSKGVSIGLNSNIYVLISVLVICLNS